MSPAVLAEGVPVITLDGWMAKRMGLCEPLRRPALSAWQAARLSEVVAHARTNSPFYRAQNNWPDVEIRCPEDICGLPFTTAADLARNVPPLLALPQSAVQPVIALTISGDSGSPKRVYFSQEDREATIDFFTHAMSLLTKSGDRVAIAFPGGRVGGIADNLAVALTRLGAEARIAPAPLDPIALAEWLRAEKPDVIVGPPVPLIAAARVAAWDGEAPLSARSLLLSSHHVAQSLARSIGAAYGAEVFVHWGMAETGYGGAVDCCCHCGCHLRENELFAETIDPQTGATALAGALGEVVVTTLSRRAVPLIRYRTGDLARLIDEPCRCGSVLRRLDGFAGRVGAAVRLPGGGELTLPRLDEALFPVEAVNDFSAIYEAGDPATLDLSVASPPALRLPASLEAVYARLAADPVIGAAVSEKRLIVYASFADAVMIKREGKRRLAIREKTRCSRAR